MPDIVDKQTRSRMMSGIRGKDTKPELQLRSSLHRAGFRYRLHDRKLPGKPDLVLAKYNTVIFVNGCFWHGHGCHLFKWPSTRQEWWRAKILRTVETDRASIDALTKQDWRIATIWECALKGRTRLDFEDVMTTLVVWLQAGETARLDISGNEPAVPIV